MHKSTKVFDGFSTCFRQWRAKNSHCSYLHGYDIDFKVTFQGDLDSRNWVMDFGLGKYIKLNSPKTGQEVTLKEWFKDCFDHTTVVALDDPNLREFYEMARANVIDMITMDHVGAEKFAEYVYQHLNPAILQATDGRVKIVSVECREHGKNSAIYEPTPQDDERIQDFYRPEEEGDVRSLDEDELEELFKFVYGMELGDLDYDPEQNSAPDNQRDEIEAVAHAAEWDKFWDDMAAEEAMLRQLTVGDVEQCVDTLIQELYGMLENAPIILIRADENGIIDFVPFQDSDLIVDGGPGTGNTASGDRFTSTPFYDPSPFRHFDITI